MRALFLIFFSLILFEIHSALEKYDAHHIQKHLNERVQALRNQIKSITKRSIANRDEEIINIDDRIERDEEIINIDDRIESSEIIKKKDDDDYDEGSGIYDESEDDSEDFEGMSGDGSGSEVSSEKEEEQESTTYETGAHVCSDEYSDKCLAPFNIIHTLEDVTPDFCSLLPETEKCIFNIFEHCVDDDSEKELGIAYYHELKETVSALCQPTINPAEAAKCLKELGQAITLETIKCTRLAAQHVRNNWALIKENDLKDFDVNCIAANFLMECLVQFAAEKCGQGAGVILEINLTAKMEADHNVIESEYCRKGSEKKNKLKEIMTK